MDWIARILKRLFWAARYSGAGLRMAWRHEQAFRLEVGVLAVLVPAGMWLGRDGAERSLLIGSWLLVMVVELLNSGIESVIDRIGPERHELSGRAKDLGSAAVLIAIALALVVWVLILLD